MNDKMTDIFRDFVFGGAHYPRDLIVRIAAEHREEMLPGEVKEANDALLHRLHEEKKLHPGKNIHDLLQNEYIAALVYTLVEVNRPLILHMLKAIRTSKHIREPLEELFATALLGNSTTMDSQPQGILGAILHYDYAEYGDHSFTTYLPRAVMNSFSPTLKQRKNEGVIESHYGINPMESRWTRREEIAGEVMMTKELYALVIDATKYLPVDRREIALKMFNAIQETGRLPTCDEIGKLKTPAVSRQRARDLMEDTIDRLHDILEEHYPQVSADGVNSYKEFSAAFPKNVYRVEP